MLMNEDDEDDGGDNYSCTRDRALPCVQVLGGM